MKQNFQRSEAVKEVFFCVWKRQSRHLGSVLDAKKLFIIRVGPFWAFKGIFHILFV